MTGIKNIFLSMLCSGFLNAQSNVKITFSNAINPSITQLKSKSPSVVKNHILKRIQNARYLSYMSIEENLVYYETKAKTVENGESSKITTSATKYSEIPSVQISVPEKRYLKNIKEKTITSYTDKKLSTENLPTINWKKTTKKKKILGYNCLEANGVFKGESISIWYTNEIKGIGSPEKIPLIKGVILEYSTPKRSSSAIKIEFNQSPIKNFFK